MKLFNSIILLIIISFSSIYSQNDSLNRIGAFLHFNYNIYSADFNKLPYCPNCTPGFESGGGAGFSIGFLYEIPVAKRSLFGLRAGYFDNSGTLSKTENIMMIINGLRKDGEFEHTIEATLTSIGIEPIFRYRAFDNLYLSAGLNAGWLISKQYSQKEEITKPTNSATFLDSLGNDSHSRTRNEYSGELEDALDMNFSLLFGISLEFPLNKERSLLIVPEAFYSIGLLPIMNSDIINSWSYSSIRTGISIKYAMDNKTAIIEKFQHYDVIDTIKINIPNISEEKFIHGLPEIKIKTEKADQYIIKKEYLIRTDTIYIPEAYIEDSFKLTADISAIGIDTAGREIKNPTIVIEEFTASRLQPILNYIFFKENSFEIRTDYSQLNKTEIGEFNEEKLFHGGTLGNYYQILNIIGSRMKMDPKSELEIVGCNSGAASDKAIKDISLKRAKTVKQYLLDIWDIDPSQIKIKSRALPLKPSTPIFEKAKIEENNRVELYSLKGNLLKPVFMTDTVRTSNPPTVRFVPESNSKSNISNWKIKAYQDQKLLIEFNNIGKLRDIDWTLEETQSQMPKTDSPLEYELSVIDNNGAGITTERKSIEIERISITRKRKEKIGDKIIDRYSLILFDFDKSEIEGINKEIVKFIKNRIGSNSSFTIAGYTDKTGEEEHNQRLSERRANQVAKALEKEAIVKKGYGESIELYDNNKPEGRFYNRTVDITVETIIK